MNSTDTITEGIEITQEINSPKVISIVSGKGGVGKSVLTANLAFQLSESGKKVLIWDTNSQFPNQHLLLAVEPPIRLNAVYSGRVSVSKSIFNIEGNLYILAGATADYDEDEDYCKSILNIYEDIINQTDFDYIIIDTSAGYSSDILNACFISDYVLTVVTDEPTSLLDAYGLIKILMRHIDLSKINLLVNNVIDFEDAEEISHKLNLALEKFLKLKINTVGYVPYNRIVRQSILTQELFTKNEPTADVTKAIIEIVRQLDDLLVLNKN